MINLYKWVNFTPIYISQPIVGSLQEIMCVKICNNDLHYKPVKVIVWDVGMNISFL